MTSSAVLFAILAAIAHAVWNAMVRVGGDRLWVVTVMTIPSTLAVLPFTFVYPPPSAEAWLYIASSVVLQVAFTVFIVQAYKYGNLSQVYPLVRGTIPLCVTAAAYAIQGQMPTVSQLAGTLLITIGILMLLTGKSRAPLNSAILAIMSGAMIASYVMIDAIGLQKVEHEGTYITWILLAYGVLMPLAFVAVRREVCWRASGSDLRTALFGGVVALISYVCILIALKAGPAGPVSAIRETSVVFVVLIGRVFLQEELTAQRLFVCVAVLAGIMLIVI